jgi:hypothetical protein
MTDPSPLFRVVRGTPTPEELAALVGVITARGRRAAEAAPTSEPSAWVRLARPGADLLGRPGAGAWRRSALPRGCGG